MFHLRVSKLPAILLLSSVSAFASNNPTVGDTYLNSAAVTTTFGSQQSILVGGTNTGLLQVNPGVPTGTNASQVAQATLTLYVNGVTTAGTIDVRRVTKTWSEAGASFSKNITFDDTSYGTITATSTGKFVTVDVTALVQYWIANPGSNLGIGLISTGADVSFDSKENTTTAHVATLDVTLINSGPQGPAGPSGPQGPVGLIGPQGPAGATGLQGPAGAKGAIGPQGPSGAAGAIGPQGPTGATGAIGPQGPTGATGAVGAEGPTGSTGAVGPQGPAGPAGERGATGPSGPTGPQGPAGPSGSGFTVKDGQGNVLGSLLSLYPDLAGTIMFRTNTGYIVTAGVDGSITNSQFYWADSACGGSNPNADPLILNAGGPGKGYDRYEFFSAKANQFYVIANSNPTTHVAAAANTSYGSLENTDNTVVSGYTCYGEPNSSYGWSVNRITPAALGVPSASGTPLRFPAPLTY